MIALTIPDYISLEQYSGINYIIFVIIKLIIIFIHFSSALKCNLFFVASIVMYTTYFKMSYAFISSRIKSVNFNFSASELRKIINYHNEVTIRFTSIQKFYRVLFLPLFILIPVLNLMAFVVIFTDGFGDITICYIFAIFSIFVITVLIIQLVNIWALYSEVSSIEVYTMMFKIMINKSF